MAVYHVNVSSILRSLGSELEITRGYAMPELVRGGESFEVKGKIGLDLLLENIGPGIRVSGGISAELLHECSRCLTPSVTPVQADIDEVFYFRSDEKYADEPDIYTVDYDVIDLGPLIEESLLIDLPVAPLCRPDCKGICPVCGQNLNEADCGHQRGMADAKRTIELRELLGPGGRPGGRS